MAHSFIEAFPDERTAFRTFAEDYPGRCTFLVDTHDTLGGVRAAIDVIRQLGLRHHLAAWLDSATLARWPSKPDDSWTRPASATYGSLPAAAWTSS